MEILIYKRTQTQYKGYSLRSHWHSVTAGDRTFWAEISSNFIRALKQEFRTELARSGWPKIIRNDSGWFKEWLATPERDRAMVVQGRLSLHKGAQ